MRIQLASITVLLTLAQPLWAGQRVVGEERQDVLTKILAQQAHLEQVSASFDVTVEIDTAQVQNLKPCWAAPILYRLTDSTVRGAIDWHRDAASNKERVDIRFDVPPESAMDYFMDRILVDDGQRQVEGYLSSRQLLVTWSRPLATWPVPSDFLYPCGRANLETVADDWSAIDVFRRDTGDFVIRFSPRSNPQTLIEAVVSPEWDYAITSWRAGQSARPAVRLDYVRDRSGTVVPLRARFERTASPQSDLVVMRWTLEATRFDVGRPDDRVFRFPFVDGMVGADYSRSKSPTEPELFHTTAAGEFVAVPRTAMLNRPTRAAQTYANIGAALVVLAFVGFRLNALVGRAA
ncbi:MAG: hypothetical protein LC135_08320 [Phycisphaerae bacterium]|jgi:hypothetical protein|nr:hypothetical protein [Phycisphaerae bacterium]MCZ2399857.1 hypothetical protein [Phycisphaerae bacterium]NUQ48490.1 hypothetical protein [Phycisphaerae bacterium]